LLVRYIALLAVSVGCYIAAFTVSGILFIWFNPSGYDCSINIFFLVMTMILAFVFAIIALHPKVRLEMLLVIEIISSLNELLIDNYEANYTYNNDALVKIWKMYLNVDECHERSIV